MNKWIEEAIRAPRDALVLLMGLASALIVLALVRPDFNAEMLRAVVENWSYWSRLFWSSLIQIDVNPGAADFMTAAVFSWTVVIRGVIQGQWAPVSGAFANAALIVIAACVGVLLFWLVLRVHGTESTGGEVWEFVATVSLFTLVLGVIVSMARTPRSFFGVVIAGAALLLFDRAVAFVATTNVGA